MFGERPPKFHFSELKHHHTLAYKLAKKYAKNKKVLDIGCGYGAGTEHFCDVATKVVGYDIDAKTIQFANKLKRSHSNLSFTSSFPGGKFGLIVSCQVIEHIKPSLVDKYLSNITKHLDSKSTVVISTVNKNVSSPNLNKPIMPFHEKEYSDTELYTLLKKHFKKVRLIGQYNKLKTGDYSNMFNFIRFISQFEIVRLVTKNTPVAIKNFLTGGLSENDDFNPPEFLTEGKDKIRTSGALIAVCSNST